MLIGAGAAGTAIARLLTLYKHPEIIAVDSKGVIMPDRSDLTDEKKFLAGLHMLSPGNEYTLKDALMGADIVIGVSRAGMLTAEDVKIMSDKAVIFALANPDPEIMPDVAKEAGAMVVATGRSDFPNQVNNLLAFPGIFRGALDSGVKKITDDHKLAAAMAIAGLVESPTADHVIPSPLDPRVCEAVANSIR